MAAVLNFDRHEAPSRAAAEAAMHTVLAHVRSLPARIGVPLITHFRVQLDAAEAESLATVVGDDGRTKTAENIAAKGAKTSKGTQRRVAKRAAAVKKNPHLAEKMAAGDLSGEHVDVLAKAESRTNGQSLKDKALIDKVAAANPDLGSSIIDEYLLDKGNASQAQSRHDRQRAKRRVSRFRTKDDCEAIMIAGDKATIDKIWNNATRRSNALYEDDGGRDVPGESHPRTHDQRMFDALSSNLPGGGTDEPIDQPTSGQPTGQPTNNQASTNTNDGSNPDGPTRNPASTHGDSDPKEPTRGGRREPGSDLGQPNTPSRRVTATRKKPAASPRPVIVIGATLDKFSSIDTDQAAEMIGSGPIADSVLAEYVAAGADLVGALYSTDGELLWLGRRVRLATGAQFLALVLRDKHCVLCGASHTRCRAHHSQPWSAPNGGETNIENLVLVCDSCHHFIHDNQQTIYRDRTTRQWTLRPALPHEIPPTRPPQAARGQAPMRT